MSEGFDKLKAIGAQKIHEATHIARAHVQAILHESFDDMSNVQFFGFISILEREYSVDLSELKNKAKEHFNDSAKKLRDTESVKVFVSPRKKRKLTALYIALGLVIFIVFSLFNTTSSENDLSKVDNSAIESATSNLSIVIDENSSILDENSTDENTTVNIEEIKTQQIGFSEQNNSEPQNEIKSFKITPNNEVWLGYIDLSTYQRYQKTFSDEFALDPSKDWLLAFGHGHINIEVNGIIKKFTTAKNIRFVYKNAELKEIDFEEFKNLNRGNRW